METQELQSEKLEKLEADMGTTAPRAEAPSGATQTREAEAFGAHGRDEDSYAGDEQAVEMDSSESAFEEDETQLAAIRELMLRACARGVWRSLGEIAATTEFAEASISAQLRHLRKAHHGAHRVEKRRRGAARAGAAIRSIGDARRGPVIWEYRVLPPA